MQGEKPPNHKRKFFIRPICGIILLLIGMTAGLVTKMQWATRDHRSIQNQHTGPTIEQVQALAELVTAKVQISDVQETKLQGYLGGVQAILTIKGEVLLGPDLSQARIVSIDEEAKTIVIELPQPRVISSRLDHEHTRLFALSHTGLWHIVPGDAGQTAVLNRAYEEAEAMITDAASKATFIGEAQRHAEQVTRSFFAAGGWAALVQWRDHDK